jgi:hypothetical protein
MNQTDKINQEKEAQDVNARKEIGEFVAKFVDESGKARKGATLEGVLKEAGYEKMDWKNLSDLQKQWINMAGISHNCKGLNVDGKGIGKDKNEFFYKKWGDGEGEFYAGSLKKGHYEWFHIYSAEADTEDGKKKKLVFLPLNKSDFVQVVNTVAGLEKGERLQAAQAIIEESRKNAQEALAKPAKARFWRRK